MYFYDALQAVNRLPWVFKALQTSLSSKANNEGPHLMIHLCTCTGGSTSTNTSSKRRSGTLSCKNCGGRSSINGKSSSSCLLSTVLELTSLINSDFTWTKVSKGCRSSSRRPRRSNTINLTKDSKVLEMPVSESEKLGVSVLGCHFSEKAEHIPIKKRRFLFRPSSPPRNPSLESPKAYNHELKLNPNAACLPESVTGMSERGSNDDKSVKKELVKTKNEPGEDDDFSGISILAAAACSNSLGAEADRSEESGIGIAASVTKSPEALLTTIELKENISKSAKEESDPHISTKDQSAPDKFPLEKSSANESTLDNSSSHSPSKSAIPTSRDVRFNWDLNTVMDDAWEEPYVSEHEVSAHNKVTFFEDKKDDCTKDNSGDHKSRSEGESGIPSKDISNLNIPIEMKSLAHENELKLGKPLSCELDNAQHSVVVESVIPVTKTLTLENPTPDIFSKWATRGGQTSATEAVDTKLSMDCSVPPGFDHYLNLNASKENMVAESAIPVTTQPAMTNTCKPEYEKHDLSLTPAASMENGDLSNKVDESMVKMELTSNDASKGTELPLQTASIPSIHDSEAPLENGIRYDNSQTDNRAGSGYDSQYEDGELRESSINAWKGEENEYVIDNRGDDLNIGIMDSHETNTSPCGQEASPGIKLTETDLTSSVVLPEKLHNTDEVLSGSEPNETVSNQANSERQEIVQNLNQSDEWKMNVSGLDHENQRISLNNFTKTRNFTSRKFSYGEQKDGFDPEDMEMKGEGSRFYRKESITRIGGPSTHDVFLSRGRFRVQGCSSKSGDGLASRPERESGVVRSFGRGGSGSGRYSPHNRGSGRGSGVWNRSPDRNQPFIRTMLEDSGSLDNITNEGSMDQNDSSNRPNTSSYMTRRPFRSRSPMNREANDFRARLGLRPTGDTGHERFNMGRSRGRGRVGQVRYGTRVDGEGPGPGPGPRRYHGPGSDECDEFLPDYPNPFPRRRRCFSPVERRGNVNGNGNHYSDSRSPSRPRTRSPVSNSGFRRRSRSPTFRMRRPRSPNYRRGGFEPEYNSGPRSSNSSPPPPNSRWVNYKERPVVFDRRSPPPQVVERESVRERERERERFGFYERKPKQNEFYRSGQPGRFDPSEAGRGRPRYVGNEGDRPDNGYRRGGFVRQQRYNMDGHVKRFQYDDEDGFGRGFDARDKHALEVHARGNIKSNGTGTDGRFKDFPRRSREDREVVVGEFKRRSRERKDSDTKEEKDQSNLDSMIMMTNEVVVKEGD
uniref:Uncharacterized protein n=2 Tax=Lactuca sativa TaxID=4236 RepID=A0A9R1V671_LACSA|nr:hypothetical protein LSAT_V11C600300820 [Lactuca sativa]